MAMKLVSYTKEELDAKWPEIKAEQKRIAENFKGKAESYDEDCPELPRGHYKRVSPRKKSA